MEVERIKKEDFDSFYKLLEQDFPYEERKSREDELEAFSHPNFHPYFVFKDNVFVGYFCHWDFNDFIFGEHFAIVKDLRDHGIGTEFLTQYLASIEKPIIIEVEKPTTITAKRRINFYNRLGLVVNDCDYTQPSYHKDGSGVPMLILTYKKKITKEEFEKYNSIIRKEVYNL